jgi:hypothetical protein
MCIEKPNYYFINSQATAKSTCSTYHQIQKIGFLFKFTHHISLCKHGVLIPKTY